MTKTDESTGNNYQGAPASPNKAGKRVLLIAEHPSTRSVVLQGFQTVDLEVDVATEGHAGLRKLRDGKPPDAVFLDLPLPDIDGLEAIKEARQRFPGGPIYVCESAFLMGVRTRRAIKAGATKVYDKTAIPMDQIAAEVAAELTAGDRSAPRPQRTPLAGSESEVRQAPLTPLEETVATLRKHVQQLGQLQDNPASVQAFEAAQNVTEALVKCATAGGKRRITLLCAALAPFLRALHQKPNQVTASSLRTLTLAVDVLGFLAHDSGPSPEPPVSRFVAILVDNDLISCKATQNALSNAGFDARTFADAAEGLNYLKAKPADLVVVDIMIAAQGGFNLFDKMREIPQHKLTPVIFIANPSDPRLSASLVPTYQTQFLVKPQNLINYLELALKALSRVLKHHADYRAAALLPGNQSTPAPAQPAAAAMPAPQPAPAERGAAVDWQELKPENLSQLSNGGVADAPGSKPKEASAAPQPSDPPLLAAQDALQRQFEAISADLATLQETLKAKETECGQLASRASSSRDELAQVRNALEQETEVRQQLEQKLQQIWGSKGKGETDPNAGLERRNQELEKLLRESATELESVKADRAKEAEEQRGLASQRSGDLNAAKAAVAISEAAHSAEVARCRQLEEKLASLQQAHKELEGKAAASAAQAAAVAARHKEEAKSPRQENDQAGISEPGRRIPQAVVSLARVTADLENERSERRRSEQRGSALTTQLQELHAQLKQHLESAGLNQSRMAALEQQMREREESMNRLSADLEKESSERQLAEEQLRASGSLSAQLQSCLSAFDQATKGFKRRQEELDLDLQNHQKALAESQSKLDKELRERQRAEEALGALQGKLQEQTQKGTGELSRLQSELSRLQSALDLEKAERRRLEAGAIQSRYGSLDAARVGLTTVNRFCKQMREPVDHLMQSTRRLLEIGMEEQQQKLVESMLEDTLLLQSSLHETGKPQDGSAGSGDPAAPQTQCQPGLAV